VVRRGRDARATSGDARRRELVAERDAITITPNKSEPPQLDSKTVMAYRRQTEKVIGSGEAAEKKRPIRTWIQDLTLEPEKLEVKINYRPPDAVMKGLVAGACTGPNAPVIPFQFEMRHVPA